MNDLERLREQIARSRRHRNVAIWAVILTVGLALLIPAINLTWS